MAENTPPELISGEALQSANLHMDTIRM